MLSSRRPPTRCRRLAGGATLWCILTLVLLASVATSGAGARRARASAHPHTSKCSHIAAHRARRASSKGCKTKSLARRLKRPAKKKPSSATVTIVAPVTATGSAALGEQAPVSAPEAPRLPGSPPVETPPAKTPPVEAPPVKKPPVKEDPVEEKPVEEKPVEKPPVETGPFRFFAPTSFWNEPVPADAPLDSSSTSVVAALAEQELAHAPAINTSSWSVPIYTVPSDQPTVRVKLVYTVSAPLQAAWSAVPLPPNAHPANGSDKHLVVWQPSSDRMWEFYGLEKVGEAWQASWGGAMQDASADRGVYGPEAWTNASTDWGASASSLPIAGGLITLEDLERGEINHALAIAVPQVRADAYASPAERTDGSSPEASSLPEGAHLRLDPSLDLAALHLPHLTLMIAEAAQRYGIFVRDRASNIALYAQDPIPTGTEPYGGSHGYYEGKSSAQLLASFPWSHLQLLKMELHAAG